MKDALRDQPKGRDARGKVWDAGAVSVPSPVGPGVPPAQHIAVFTNLTVSVFLLKFNYIGMID